MALGGGVWVTQNKTLPGSYINFINLSSATSALGERGVVAIALPLDKAVGTVIECTVGEFAQGAVTKFGKTYDSDDLLPIREIFKNATKVYVFDLGTGDTAQTVAQACAALESYEFNVLCAYTSTALDVTSYVTQVTAWRDSAGKKCQVVVYNTDDLDYEGAIDVVSTVSDDGVDAHALTAWVAGAEAGCAVNASCTNKLYDGELTITTNKTQAQLEQCITNGEFAFHLVYGTVRVLEDINTLVTTTTDKGEDFKSNQTIRVVDQIANDIAKLFNTKYLGQIQNNASGRVSFWADIVAHHRDLEQIGAIENFDSTLVMVEPGESKKAIVVNDVVTVTNAMAQLYMTVVIQ